MFKKLLCITAALILCLSSFIVPSYANDVETYDFSNYSLPELGEKTNQNNLIQELKTQGLFIYSIGEETYYFGGYTTSNYLSTPIYYFRYGYKIVFVADTSTGGYMYSAYLTGSDSWGSVSSTYTSNSYTYNNHVVKYNEITLDNRYIITDMYEFNTRNDGLQAFINYIENPPTPTPTDPNYDDLPDFYIQRGYAAYIDFGSDWSTRSCSGTFTSTFPQYSSLISGDWDGTDNRRYFWTASLPSNTSFSSNVGSAIDWTKVAPYDLLQRSKNGIWFIQSNSPQNRYLVIVNPNQWRYGQTPTEDTLNSSIKVSDLSGSTGDVKFFALNQQFDQNGTLVSSASDDASNNRTGTYDPDTNTWSSTDSNGNAADQVPGGMSDTPVVSSITDYISNITNILTNFANSVISLIQAPISHIAQLIEAGSGFMGALRGLYGWLPVDIQGLVISALTVVIGIGVFKVFL